MNTTEFTGKVLELSVSNMKAAINERYGSDKPAAEQAQQAEPVNQQRAGVYRKFNVSRTDGRDQPGGDRHGAEYFVLDVTHDKFAKPALAAYAAACRNDYPALADDMVRRYGIAQQLAEPVSYDRALIIEMLNRYCECVDARTHESGAVISQMDLLAAAAQPPAVACNHRIADARNPVVSSGYVCVDCGALFSAADHNEPPAVAVPDASQMRDALEMMFGSNPSHSVCHHEGADIFGRVKGTWSLAAETACRTALAAAPQAAVPDAMRSVTNISMETVGGSHRVVLQVGTLGEMYELSKAMQAAAPHPAGCVPDPDGWIAWNGGACPVAKGVKTEIRMRNGETATYSGHLIGWNHLGLGSDVVAYRAAQKGGEA